MSSHLAAEPSPPPPDAFNAATAGGDDACGRGPWREPPWLLPPVLSRVDWILEGHQRAFGQPLLAGLAADLSSRQRAQELFIASRLVLAHDGGADPRLIYANRAALALWRRRWDEMLGLPSRLTAEPEQRADRARALARALDQEALRGYGGIRVDRLGRRFRIDAARLWTLRDSRGKARGQAASFSSWWWL